MRTEEARPPHRPGQCMDGRHIGAKETIVAYILLGCLAYITVAAVV